MASFSNTGTFLPLFFPTGSNSQRSTSNEVYGQFQTGEFLGRFRDSVQASAINTVGSGAGLGSSQAIITNRLDYAMFDWLSIYGLIGLENNTYEGTPSTHIADTVWGFGATLTPNPDSQISIGYGHQNGFNSINFNANYALTARTTLSASYYSTVQTQLQQIQSQLNLASINQNGTLVNSQTGQPIFLNNAALGVQSGLFETRTFAFTATTLLDRDQISLTAQYQENKPVSSVPGNTANSGHGTIGSVSWLHQINIDLLLATGVSYSVSSFSGTGTQTSVGAVASLQYQISSSLTGNMRYAFYDQKSTGQNIYQNLFLVGISKQF